MLVDPPMAMSTRIAFSKAARLAMESGSTERSSSSYQRRQSSTTSRPASRKRPLRAAEVASVVPLPGSARPMTSSRQFMEFAVNMPAQEPHVGHAERSIAVNVASLTPGSTAAVMASMRSRPAVATPFSSTTARPASIAPPLTNTVGMFRRRVASSIPGVILSQLLMHTRASAWWAFTMYSTESAMSSRLGSEYSMPP